jgi:DNA-binding MarR family transcriptional regulator
VRPGRDTGALEVLVRLQRLGAMLLRRCDERLGLVTRVAGPVGRRGVIEELTAAGEALADRSIETHCARLGSRETSNPNVRRRR